MKLLNSRIYMLVALFIGAVYALTIFEPSFILGKGVYWTEPFGDRFTNFIGSLYFAHDGWRWPLLYVPSLATPEGANIIYTDSIPLFALAMKLIYKITGEWYNYFGFWLFACFPLLAFFIALAAKKAGGKDPVTIIGAALFALASPAFLVRFGHAALMGHFLIAWCLLLYLNFGRTSSLRSSTLQFSLIASLSVVLQMYFLLMVMPFLIAALIQSKTENRISLRGAIFSFAVVIGSIIVMAVIVGLIGPGTVVEPAWGFGYYSMNVLSPFLPPRSHLPDFISQFFTWDGNGISVDATGGQYEGYNYLGAGVLSLIVVHIAFSRSFIKQSIKRHKFLTLMLVFLLLLALSTRVYLGSQLVLNVEFLNSWIKPLIGNFRTSGRFFWPVYYVLVVFLVLLTFRRFSPNVARAVIVAAVVFQMTDTQPFRQNMAQATQLGYPQKLDKQAWTNLISVHKFVKQYPSFQCGGWAVDWPGNNSNMEFLLLAAELDKPTNSAYLARAFRNCQDEFTEGLKFEIQNGGLYIYGGKTINRYVEKFPDFKKLCRKFEFAFVCSQSWALLPQFNNSLEFREVNVPLVSEYHLGDTLDFTINSKAEQYLGYGWYTSETWGTWSMGKESNISFKLATPPNNSLIMSVNARAYLHPNRPNKTINVYVNDEKITSWNYVLGEDIVTRTVTIPRKLFKKNGVIKIRFVSDKTESPFSAGFSKDKREISLGLVSAAISQ